MSGLLYQVISAVILHFNCLNYGMTLALPSSTLTMFMSANTTLDRPMTETEGSLMGSLASIGGLISNLLMGIMLDRLGRKNSAILCATVSCISWCILVISSRVELVLVAVFISGIGATIFLVVAIYISEFSEDSVRGTLTSGAMAFYGLGMLISYLLGGYLEYKSMLYVCMSLSALGVVLQTFLKESPICLLKKGLEKEAAMSIAFYRNDKIESKVVQQELSKLKRSLAPQTEEMFAEEEKLTQEATEIQSSQKLSCWQFFKTSRSSKRAFFIAITLMTFAIFQGMMIVQIYAKPLFSEAIPETVMSATWCSVLLAVVSVVAGLITAYLTDLAGRRTLMIYGSTAAGVLTLALGTQIHFHWGPHWFSAVFIYLFCTAFIMGAGTVPFLLIGELFLPEVKSILSMIVMEWTWLCSFIALFIFTPLVSAIGLGPVFYFFSTVCFISAAFSFFFLPETKGLSVEAIQLRLVPKKNIVI